MTVFAYFFSFLSLWYVCVSYGYEIDTYGPSNIERPCPLHDLDCIRRVLAHNSNCEPVRGVVPDPYILDWLPLHVAFANLTFILRDSQARGLNKWKIEEFFFNKATGNVVLEVVFDTITVYCPGSLVRYFRKGREPVEMSDFSLVVYKGISLTLTVPNVKNIPLSGVHIFPYIPNANLQYSVGSALMDDTVLPMFADMIDNFPISLREVFYFKGPVFMAAVLQNSICRFNEKTSHYSIN